MFDNTGMSHLRVLFLGDIVGRPGREAIKRNLERLKAEYPFDLLVANGENAAGGLGISLATAVELWGAEVALITLGDHAWKQSEASTLLNKHSSKIIRPANYPDGAPGVGWTLCTEVKGAGIGVLNLIGRTFTGALVDCPFRKADEVLNGPLSGCKVRICDFHAEATSEKAALARYLDGRVSFLAGTHTHVQTADEQVSPQGTAFITDLGMCGCTEGVIGMDASSAVQRFITGRHYSYKLAQGRSAVCGAWCSIDLLTGKALEIKRVRVESSE